MTEGAYSAQWLGFDEARKAYALISLAHPEVTLPHWRTFVRRFNRGRRSERGIVAVSDSRGTIHAVFAYQVETSLKNADALCVSDIVMGRLPGGSLPRALIACVDRLAEQLGRSDVKISILEEILAPQDRAALGEAGFATSGVQFARRSSSRRDAGREV